MDLIIKFHIFGGDRLEKVLTSYLTRHLRRGYDLVAVALGVELPYGELDEEYGRNNIWYLLYQIKYENDFWRLYVPYRSPMDMWQDSATWVMKDTSSYEEWDEEITNKIQNKRSRWHR